MVRNFLIVSDLAAARASPLDSLLLCRSWRPFSYAVLGFLVVATEIVFCEDSAIGRVARALIWNLRMPHLSRRVTDGFFSFGSFARSSSLRAIDSAQCKATVS
jgi:hypothetical protein